MTLHKGLNPRIHGLTEQSYRLAMGEFPGITHIHKFGRNPVISTTEEDIWNVGGKETLLTTGTTMYISCEDNVNGVGQTMLVQGLDENWEEYEAEVVLTGHTQAQIGNANGWTRVHRAYQVSATPDPVGDVWIAESDTLTLGVPDTASKVHAKVEYTDAPQQTEKAMFTVPAGHVGLLGRVTASIVSPLGTARSLELGVEVQEIANGVSLTGGSPLWTPWRRIDSHSMVSSGTTSVEETYLVPRGPFPEGTNIHLRATATADTEVYADFSLTLIHTGS